MLVKQQGGQDTFRSCRFCHGLPPKFSKQPLAQLPPASSVQLWLAIPVRVPVDCLHNLSSLPDATIAETNASNVSPLSTFSSSTTLETAQQCLFECSLPALALSAARRRPPPFGVPLFSLAPFRHRPLVSKPSPARRQFPRESQSALCEEGMFSLSLPLPIPLLFRLLPSLRYVCLGDI